MIMPRGYVNNIGFVCKKTNQKLRKNTRRPHSQGKF